MMKILSIIVTYNGMRWIDRCIKSVLDSSISTDIYVIDNFSTDNTVEHIKKMYHRVMVYETNENLGFGKANNIGLKYALDNSYDYVYLLNQDAWIEQD
ncbi:MAG: glycosyltransferase, partial [Muribaculum sp.]|nr:glycosyltransferase [Muribaculum sp.]